MSDSVSSAWDTATGAVTDTWKAATDVVKPVLAPIRQVTGGAAETARDITGGVAGGVRDAWDGIDDFVTDEIPGGWVTVAVVAGGYYAYEAGMFEAGAATEAGTAGATTAEVGAGTTAGTAGAEVSTSALAGVEGGTAATAGVEGVTQLAPVVDSAAPVLTDLGAAEAGLAPVVDSTAPVLSQTGQMEALASSTSDPIAAMNAQTGWTSSNPAYLEGVGVPEAIVANAPVTSAEVDMLSQAAGGADQTWYEKLGYKEAYIADKAQQLKNAAKKIPTSPQQQKKSSVDTAVGVGAALKLLYDRRKARAERNYATGGDVAPTVPTATLGTAQSTAVTPGMTATATSPGEVTQAVAATPVTATSISAPTAITAPTIAASTSQGAIEKQMEGVQAAQGQVTAQDLAVAATQAPTTTAVAGLQAAQGTAAQVAPVADRTLQAGELVSGTAVDQAKVDAALKQNVAAQGTVTEEMTTQGQLNKIMSDFDAGNPPPWASASMRAATAQLAARGLGASSLAGQAIVQAALEAATPIAAADAKVFEQMGLTNLSNRQAMALTTAQQRAAFLGQEFDQNFQTKVLNAAKISDIADKNFAADVQVALENAQLANTMNLANLSNKQALTMATAAQMANLETTNLNNRQQVAVENAKAFLAMDMKNVDLKQQTTLFKAQEISQSILADTAAENAAKATNAANALDASKVNAQLALTASEFNASERNKVALANMATAQDLLKFNAEAANKRSEFNANLSTQVNMANAKVLADISTANTREANAMAAVNAKNATDMSASTYAQQQQTYRDQLEMTWKTGDNNLQRANDIAKQTIAAEATKYSADATAEAAFSAAIGQLSVSLLANGGSQSLVDEIKSWVLPSTTK